MSRLQIFHHPRHFQRRLRCFRSAIVFFAEAADFGVLHFFKNEHAVDDGNFLLHLNLRQRVCHAQADMLRVAGLALKNDAETDDRRVARLVREFGRRRRNLKRARHAHDADVRARREQRLPRRAQHGVHILRVVARRDDGERAAASFQFLLWTFAQHNFQLQVKRNLFETRDKSRGLQNLDAKRLFQIKQVVVF
jgi:hypothetical protein